jgi:hypothetical protein
MTNITVNYVARLSDADLDRLEADARRSIKSFEGKPTSYESLTREMMQPMSGVNAAGAAIANAEIARSRAIDSRNSAQLAESKRVLALVINEQNARCGL